MTPFLIMPAVFAYATTPYILRLKPITAATWYTLPIFLLISLKEFA